MLSIGLAAATLVLVLFPFLESLNFVLPSLKPLLWNLVIVQGSAPKWIAPTVGIIAPALAALSFVISRKQRSFLVSGLLVVSGTVYSIGTALAAVYLFGLVVPGPILGTISGLIILALGIAKTVRTKMMVIQQ